ncbi:MAG: LacI family transcriptional regulator [Chloroflexi bacterium]|nr:LacI family transcriptional regulator [Chloroflexota bacterium]
MTTTAGQKRVTIKQVAREAGVSTQTVSRVINERPDVAPDTRQRVLDVIADLGYRPNVLARSLISQRSHTLGVVTAGLAYTGPSRTLNGITTQAEAMDYTLLLKELPDFDHFDVETIVDDLLARQVDGIIWAVQEVGDNRDGFEERWDSFPVPIVFLTMEERTGWPSISIDNYSGGCMATEHLLSLGHIHVGHIAGPQSWWEARERKRGWSQTMQAAGHDLLLSCWVEGTWSSASGERLAQALFEQCPDLTAIFAANDQMALGALQYAHRNGIQVPQELSIVGFDGIPESLHFWPPLTTVSHDHHELGCHAVRTAVGMIEAALKGEAIHRSGSILIEPTLMVRTSSSPPNPVSI